MAGGIGVLLLAAVGGYWVLDRASTKKGQLQQVGQIVGSVILIISLLGVVCFLWCAVSGASCPVGMKPFGRSGKAMFCPYTAPAPDRAGAPSAP